MLMTPLEDLLQLLDEEINIRNTHTHEQFLNVVLDTGYDIFNPQDALIDLQKNETARNWSFLHAADGWIRRPV
jgi:hypothetical protein